MSREINSVMSDREVNYLIKLCKKIERDKQDSEPFRKRLERHFELLALRRHYRQELNNVMTQK